MLVRSLPLPPRARSPLSAPAFFTPVLDNNWRRYLMTEPKTRTVAPTRMWTIALALALTCAAPAADAALARVVIDSFTVTGTPDDPNDFLFAPTDGELQSWILQAERNNGATSQTNSNTVLTWNPQTATAQTANSFANVASSIQSSFP